MDKFLLWHWKAINNDGQIQRGAILALSQLEVYQQLFEKQFQVLSIHKARFTHRGCWTAQQKIQIFRQLATLLQAGITLADGLTLIAEHHPSPEWKALLHYITQQVACGVPFSQTLQQWPKIFPSLFIALVHIGELTGRLDDCCRMLADQQEQSLRLHKKVRKALRYPAFMLLMVLLVTVGMMGWVLPEFASIYRSFNAPLPTVTIAVMAASDWMVEQGKVWLLICAGLMSGVMLLRTRKPHWQVYEQRLLLQIPLLSALWRGQILSQIYTTLSLTQQAGIPLLQGLSAVEKTLTPRLWKNVIAEMKQKINAGNPLWRALDEAGRFTPLCSQLLRTGEESGSLDLMFDKLAVWHYNHTHELADDLTGALEPIMMVVMSIIIGTLVIAMYLPIFQLGEAMSVG